ncbi:YbjN domain-containing protein [bacterium]|nr:YbjN domain-containing protein [candidate division CSSED10-310 bacterium]
MSQLFSRLKSIVSDLGLGIEKEVPAEELLVVSNEERGIANMIVDIEDPLIIIEQPIMAVAGDNAVLFRRLLQMNRELVHGAFVLNEDASMVFFRDTLELHTMDQSELESSINALSLALAENATELLHLAGM